MKHQASNVKKLSFTLTLVLLFTTLFSQISPAAVTRLPQINLSPRLLANQTEGSICAGCATRSPQATTLGQLTQINNSTEQIFNAAYFSNNGDRSTLVELRNKRARGEFLTAEEGALVQAGDRVGRVLWLNCKNPTTGQSVNGNAFLIKHDGRDAIMTSAHLIRSAGRLTGDCNLNDFSKAIFRPNLSYAGQTGPASISDDEFKLAIGATVDQRFGGFSEGTADRKDDWMVLFLDQQISSLPAPNQTAPRGFIQFANPQTPSQQYESYIFGTDNKQEIGVTTYQECATVVENETSYNSCDTYGNSSGSLIGNLENGEIKFQSVNNRNSDYIVSESNNPLPTDYKKWNQGLSSEYIYNEIQRVLNPNGTDI